MGSPLSLLFGSRRDPWWDVEGRSLRRERRLKRLIELVMIVLGLLVAGGALSLTPQAGTIHGEELVPLLLASWILAFAASLLRAKSRISVL